MSSRATGRTRIIEIGAGSGWQAKKLAEQGFELSAIDIAKSSSQQEWPIIEYDGFHIPFPDHHFDIIFSSNTLEHIPHVQEFQSELQRVLKPNGIAIQILPSGAWRFWTTLAYYPDLVKALFKRFFKLIAGSSMEQTTTEVKTKPGNIIQKLRRVLIVPRHGELGNSVTEIYYFSRFRWSKLFRKTGWTIEQYYPNRLFYTGYGVFERRLSISSRYYLSYVLGSSCHIFILRKIAK